jgi:hypothetical protein
MRKHTDYLFSVRTPLGFSIRTTVDYWALIEVKHPKLRGRIQDVIHVLTHPDHVCQSTQDARGYLFYRAEQHHLLCAGVKRLNGEGFLITAYPCDKVKEGEKLWPT